MCTNWKGFTLKAILLASLSLFLFGCGNNVTPEAPVLKAISGIVADSSTGQRSANATVTAYAVDAAGNVSTSLLGVPPSVQSDGQGNFVMNIPESYTGGVMFQAVAAAPPVASLKSSQAGSVVLRSLQTSVKSNETVVISLATELVVQYIEKNKSSSFTAANIQKAILVLEPFLGQNFTQTAPPAVGSTPTVPQQQLVIMTQAIESLVATGNYTLASLVTVNSGTNTIAIGEGTALAGLSATVTTITKDLITVGAVSGSFTLPAITPVTEPDLSDTTAPTTPTNLTATSTTSAVTLSWGAASDAVGVTAYNIYRDSVFIASATSSARSFTDSSLKSGTTFTYEVIARDAAGNKSAASSVNIATAPILTYKISGKISSGTTGLASVYVVISGAGSGVFITDADGNYSMAGVSAGSYTVTPVFSGYTFTPSSKTVAVIGADVSAIDFSATAVNAGTVVGGITYPAGTVTGGISYPPGTVIGGISYPSGLVIGGITYPTSTIIGGVTYPTGTVIGGVAYPNGVIIGGVNYPSGTIVGGVAFPLGTLIGSITYPSSGEVKSQVTYGVSGKVVRAPTSSEVQVIPVGVAGVIVNVVNSSNATVATASTDSTGSYYFKNITNGSYTVSVDPAYFTGSGFTTATSSSITITTFSSAVGNIVLSP